MRRPLFIALALVFCLFRAPGAYAQEQKIGFVNTDYLLSQMPEYEGVQRQLQLLGEDWKKKLQSMQQEIDRLRQEFEQREILYSDSVRKQRQDRISTLVDEREQFMEQIFGTQGEYFQKQQELLNPLQQRIMEAIGAVAERQEFDFVLDRARQTSLVFGREEWNLNAAVLQEMDITPDETSN